MPRSEGNGGSAAPPKFPDMANFTVSARLLEEKLGMITTFLWIVPCILL